MREGVNIGRDARTHGEQGGSIIDGTMHVIIHSFTWQATVGTGLSRGICQMWTRILIAPG